MSLTDEQINALNFDSLRTFDSDQKPLLVNSMDSSTTTTAHLTPSTQHTTAQHSITASVPHNPQLTTTMHMSSDMVEKAKQALEVNVQAEYQQRTTMRAVNPNNADDDDFIPPEPPARTDYGKKALVHICTYLHCKTIPFSSIGSRSTKLSSIEIRRPLSCFHHQFSHVVLQGNSSFQSTNSSFNGISLGFTIGRCI